MLIFGVDPGYRHCGIAALQCAVPQRDVLRATPKVIATAHLQGGGSREDALSHVCEQIHGFVTEVMDMGLHDPQGFAFACEEQAGVYAGKSRAGATSADARALEQVVGAVRMLRTLYRPAVFQLVSPGFMRSVAGLPRNASKARLAEMLQRLVHGWPGAITSHESEAVAVCYAVRRLLDTRRSLGQVSTAAAR